jgi:hypothetical protein
MEILSGKNAGNIYDTFCLEKRNYFNPGSNYIIESIGPIAFGGGIDNGGPFESPNNNPGDPVSWNTMFLYAAYFDNVFGQNKTMAAKVQNAIWYLEDEVSANLGQSTLDDLWEIATAKGYQMIGWNIQVANIVVKLNENFDNQSQLIGFQAPIPEPSTMILFGIGLMSLAGIGRKKVKK